MTSDAGAQGWLHGETASTRTEQTCWPCGSQGDDDGHLERSPGWCSSCGFFFDRYGMQIFEPWLTCPVHIELRSMCPHPAQ
jgi:hypothetical protein